MDKPAPTLEVSSPFRAIRLHQCLGNRGSPSVLLRCEKGLRATQGHSLRLLGPGILTSRIQFISINYFIFICQSRPLNEKAKIPKKGGKSRSYRSKSRSDVLPTFPLFFTSLLSGHIRITASHVLLGPRLLPVLQNT